MMLAQLDLDDKYSRGEGVVFLTGTQALVRLLLTQARRDRAAGLSTGGFVAGYRGSPLGAFDRELWRAGAHLAAHDIRFWPAVNEDLAATAVWGSQEVQLLGKSRRDGVFALWYGKGAGLDRSGDALRHGHVAGTAPQGGVLVVVGDDHGMKSSTNPYHAEPSFADLLMPVLFPSSLAEMIEYGLHGWAMSRHSGCWVGFKTLAEIVDSAGAVPVSALWPEIVLPEAAGAVHLRWPDPWLAGEPRLLHQKLPAATAYARANRLDRVVLASPRPRLGIVTAGKAYADLRQALLDLGLDDATAAGIGLSIYKVAMPWPLDGEGIKAFAHGLEEILVVEEKRPFLETQIKEVLYDWPDGRRPRVVGKQDDTGAELLPWIGDLGPDAIARALGRRLGRFHDGEAMRARLARLAAPGAGPAPTSQRRAPYFCPGCPHNSSTRVPAGSLAKAGVGCHFMAVGMDRATLTSPQMGGEGVSWIGAAPFSETGHLFVNLGDGTYYHSGSLAIRACISAGVNVTFKLLFNDAVAMTGGQPVDGPLSVPQLSRQLRAEGVERIALVSDDIAKYGLGRDLAPGTSLHPRAALDAVQRELRTVPGVSALIYEQTCAAEKRRRRKRGKLADPERRVVINDLVCEGCGDCGLAANCLAIAPLETEFGIKRAIDQSACNKDFSCLLAACPSLVTVEGGRLRKPEPGPPPALPAPAPAVLDRPWGIFITGVGGTGVVTISAVLGMAAHLEGKACATVDMLGMAQKGGGVVSHVRLAPAGTALPCPRVPTGGADLLLAADLLMAAQPETLAKLEPGHSRAVINLHQTVTGAFTRDTEALLPMAALRQHVVGRLGEDRATCLDATALAEGLIGDSIATNLFLLGVAFQQGLIPLSEAALTAAIRLNGVAIGDSLAAFAWGRAAAADPAAVAAAQARVRPQPDSLRLSGSLDEAVERRRRFLADYQDDAWAARYATAVARVRAAEAALGRPGEELAAAAAASLFRLMSTKDEYEVARLLTAPAFTAALAQRFDGPTRLVYHLAPPLLATIDPASGRPRKRAYGPWFKPVLGLLARLRGLRGGRLDPFGRSGERRAERAFRAAYETMLGELLAGLTPANHAEAVALARLPERLRGYGPVRREALERIAREQAERLAAWRTARPAAA